MRLETSLCRSWFFVCAVASIAMLVNAGCGSTDPLISTWLLVSSPVQTAALTFNKNGSFTLATVIVDGAIAPAEDPAAGCVFTLTVSGDRTESVSNNQPTVALTGDSGTQATSNCVDPNANAGTEPLDVDSISFLTTTFSGPYFISSNNLSIVSSSALSANASDFVRQADAPNVAGTWQLGTAGHLELNSDQTFALSALVDASTLTNTFGPSLGCSFVVNLSGGYSSSSNLLNLVATAGVGSAVQCAEPAQDGSRPIASIDLLNLSAALSGVYSLSSPTTSSTVLTVTTLGVQPSTVTLTK